MRVITGDECGLLKEVIPSSASYVHPEETAASSKVKTITPVEQQSRERGIIALAKLENQEQHGFAALLRNGTVETYHSPAVARPKKSAPPWGQFSQTQVIPKALEDLDVSTACHASSPLHPIGMGCYRDCDKTVLAACTSRGDIRVLTSMRDSTHFQLEAKYNQAVVNNYENQNLGKRSIAKHPPCIMTAFAMDCQKLQCAVAGRDRETLCMDLNTGQVTWHARNVKNNLTTLLPYPIWGTAAQFLPFDQPQSNLLAVGTAYQQVRIYDLRLSPGQRRPILMTPLDPTKDLKDGESAMVGFRVTSLCSIGGNYLGIGDAAGYAYSLDIRRMDRVVGRYRGPCGSVRSMSMASDQKDASKATLAMVGMDRYLRTFHVSTRKSIDAVYLKQRLNCCLAFDDPPAPKVCDEDDVEEKEKLVTLEEQFTGNVDEEDHVEEVDFESGSEMSGHDNEDDSENEASDGIDEHGEDSGSDSDSDDDDNSDDDDDFAAKDFSRAPQRKRRKPV